MWMSPPIHHSVDKQAFHSAASFQPVFELFFWPGSHCVTVRNPTGLFTSRQKETLSHFSCYIRASWQHLNRSQLTFTQTSALFNHKEGSFFFLILFKKKLQCHVKPTIQKKKKDFWPFLSRGWMKSALLSIRICSVSQCWGLSGIPESMDDFIDLYYHTGQQDSFYLHSHIRYH